MTVSFRIPSKTAVVKQFIEDAGGTGDSIVDHEAYELLRPSTKSQWAWQYLQGQLA
jgi:hypothetical protein